MIIGTDDHNTLAVVRDLGKHDCNISVLIHGDFTSIHDVKISKSRYGKNKTDYVNDSIEKIYEWIKRNAKQKSNLKTILFPCSDLAAYTVDYYGKELGNCIIPGFKGQPGRVVELMDKINQKKFADCYGIPIAKDLARKNNLDVVYSKRLDSESERNHYGINRFSDGPLDFIKEIECADYVVVSSFHGVAFSILMEKNFIALLHENTGSRVHSLLRKLGLQDRIVKNFEDYQNRKFAAIDYTRVRPIIENWKMESIEHLRKICEL